MKHTARSLALATVLVTLGCGSPDGRPGWPDGAFDGGKTKVGFRDTVRPWIIGHRGTGIDDDAEPQAENTIPALLFAIRNEGAIVVEFDVMLTKDQQLVVMHDPRLDRTTDCTGCVSERTLADVEKCTSTSGDLAGAVHPPAFVDALEALGALPVEPLIMVDTKLAPLDGCPLPVATTDEHAPTLGRLIGKALQSAGLAHTAGVQGPEELLVAARGAAPKIMTLVARPSMGDAVELAKESRMVGVAVGLEKLNASDFEDARAAGELVDTFVVNAPIDLTVAVSYGADVIETDRVEAMLEAFQE